MSNLIGPSLDIEIYYLFHKEPVQGFILKILHVGLERSNVTEMTTR